MLGKSTVLIFVDEHRLIAGVQETPHGGDVFHHAVSDLAQSRDRKHSQGKCVADKIPAVLVGVYPMVFDPRRGKRLVIIDYINFDHSTNDMGDELLDNHSKAKSIDRSEKRIASTHP